MRTRVAIGSVGLVVFACAAVGLISVSASEETPLGLCLHRKETEENVRMDACQRAAKMGHAKAILMIGMGHVYGKGVSKDYAKAYMYFKVLHHVSDTLDERQRKEAREYSQRLMKELKERMTPSDISRAGALARDWINDNLGTTKRKQ